MGVIVDLTGQRFGRLVALKRIGLNKHGRALWLCQCDCGNETEVVSNALLRNDGKGTRSCGCLWNEAVNASNKKLKTSHGLYGTRIYTVWKDMIYRCEKPQFSGYEHYGGRGISVCEEWHDVRKFAEWAYTHGYDDTAKKGDCTIERLDVNGNYEPSNCVFVDTFTQNANRRNTLKVEVNGKMVPLMVAVKNENVEYDPVYTRIHLRGDTFEEAVNHIKQRNQKQ